MISLTVISRTYDLYTILGLNDHSIPCLPHLSSSPSLRPHRRWGSEGRSGEDMKLINYLFNLLCWDVGTGMISFSLLTCRHFTHFVHFVSHDVASDITSSVPVAPCGMRTKR